MRPEQLTLDVDGAPLACLLHARGDEERGGVVLPGAGYTPGHPLLWFVREALQAEGLAVLEVWWSPESAPEDLERRTEWTLARADAALAAAHLRFDSAIVVGKSLGTLALAALHRAGSSAAPGIWLTPLLAVPWVLEVVEGLEGPALLVVGGADVEASPPEAVERARAAGRDVLQIEGADHVLEVGDPLANLRALERVVEHVRGFARDTAS